MAPFLYYRGTPGCPATTSLRATEKMRAPSQTINTPERHLSDPKRARRRVRGRDSADRTTPARDVAVV